jgi:hypothetical protein
MAQTTHPAPSSGRASIVSGLGRRRRALDRSAEVSFVGIATLLAGAIAVRVWFIVSYPTAFVGFPDASQYARAAALGIFRDSQRPAGYPLFLRLIHHLSAGLSFAMLGQHALGIATGLLLYRAMRRTGAPPWLGLLPAAVVFFGGTGLFLEHSLLADSLFTFLQAVGIYGAVCALYDPRLRWPVLAGLAIGADFWVKTAALSSLVLVPLVLLCAAPGGAGRRLLAGATTALLAIALILAYVGSQYYFTGYLGYERESAYDLYGRVATFVECSKFTPPAGTGFLCPSEPVGHRRPPAYYQDSPNAPAVERFGPPYAAFPHANEVLKEFSVAAIEQEPVQYAKAIVRGLSRYVFPRAGEGYTPQSMRESVVDPPFAESVQPRIDLLYPNNASYLAGRDIAGLSSYESDTRVGGPLLVLLLLAAIGGPPFLRGRLRWAAVLFTLTALFSITFAVAGNGYDARYAYPTFGPIAAGAALGAWGIALFLARAIRARRTRGAASSPGSTR